MVDLVLNYCRVCVGGVCGRVYRLNHQRKQNTSHLLIVAPLYPSNVNLHCWNAIPPALYRMLCGKYTYVYAPLGTTVSVCIYDGGTWSPGMFGVANVTSPNPVLKCMMANLSGVMYGEVIKVVAGQYIVVHVCVHVHAKQWSLGRLSQNALPSAHQPMCTCTSRYMYMYMYIL